VNKTKIEWVKNPDGTQGYTLNPCSGCRNHTPDGLCLGGLFPCYAWKLAHTRLKQRYLANKNGLPYSIFEKSVAEELKAEIDPFYPRFWEERLHEPDIEPTKPQHMKGIFVCDMGDLFGIGIPEVWTREVLNVIWSNPWHRFYLLTKQPQNLIKFSPFPDNCWVGITATNTEMFLRACSSLEYPVQAKVKYLSVEPLLQWSFNWEQSYLINALNRADIKLVIIGACTGRSPELLKLQKHYPSLTLMPYGHQWTAQPPIENLREIVEAADQAGIKVFLKDNLRPLLKYPIEYKWAFTEDRGSYHMRQEMPERY